MLICMQKISHFFLKILQKIANFLFWIIWACPDTHTENDSIIFKKSVMFTRKQKINFILPTFFLILQIYWKLVILGTLSKSGYTDPKYHHLVENYRLYLQAKEPVQPHVFLEILHRHANFLFWVLWPCLDTQTQMVVWTCRKFWSFSAYQKCTSSFTSSLRYYILKNLEVWLANSISAT